jgi:hypothetical protein
VTTIEEVEGVLAGGDEADVVVRRVVDVLHDRLGRYVRLRFVEEEGLVDGPAAGEETEATAFPVLYRGTHVAELEVGGELTDGERALLQRVAELIAEHALVAWDTGGEAWQP